MNRTEKLFDSLANLEAQFLKMVIDEFEHRYPSSYLSRKTSHAFDGKKWRNARTGELERLEKEILALREKLGEPVAEGPIAVVHDFVAAREAANDRYHGGIERLQREARERLEEMSRS